MTKKCKHNINVEFMESSSAFYIPAFFEAIMKVYVFIL